MGWDELYRIVNGYALLFWLLLAFAPRGPKILALVLYAGVGGLAVVYAVLLGGFMTGGIDPGGTGGGSFTSLNGVMQLFAQPGGTVLGWTHYLAFDLFIGMWIARDADAKGFGRLFQLPFLFLTLMVGPVGLLSWLIVREPAARRMARRG